jgi:hypothetical protein
MKRIAEFLPAQLCTEAEAIVDDARWLFGHLSAAQLNWTPSASHWSIGQYLVHLINANRAYFPQLDQIIRGEKQNSWWQSMPVLPGFFGQRLVQTLAPGARWKTHTPKSFLPPTSTVNQQIVGQFIAHQQELIARMRATARLDWEYVIIYSPATKLVTYSLLDAYRFIVLHERKHFEQAQKVMSLSGYPRYASEPCARTEQRHN